MKTIRTLYFECFSGISGDMIVGALIDLGVSFRHIKKILEKLPVTGYEIDIEKEKRVSISGTSFSIVEDKEYRSVHCRRNIEDINQLLLCSDISEGIKETAIGIFKIIAQAQAKAYDENIMEIRFCEVGPNNSIIEIVAIAICLEVLRFDQVVASTLHAGHGYEENIRGKVPIPLPEVMNIINDFNLSMKLTSNDGEMITSAGAATLAYLQSEDRFALEGEIIKTGIGIGRKQFEYANVLRVMMLERPDEAEDDLWMLETDLADSANEALSYGMKIYEQTID